MVAPKHVRRTEEIKRLTEQLEQLREKQKQLQSSTPAASKPSINASSTNITSDVPSTTPSSPSSSPSATEFTPGKHSAGNRFLSISSVESEEYHPRVLLVAGAVPGLKTSDFAAVPPMLYSKPPTKGNLFLSRLPENFSGDFITMQTFDTLARCGDPVVILAAAEEVSAAKLPITPNDDVVLIVDREMTDFQFNKNHFYAWDVNGTVKIGWVDSLPPVDSNIKIIGRIVYGHLEVDSQLRKKKSCWEEENETYA